MSSGDKGGNSWTMTTKGLPTDRTDFLGIVEHVEGSLSEQMDGGSCSRNARRRLSVEAAKQMRASFDRQKDFLMVSGVYVLRCCVLCGVYVSILVIFFIQFSIFMYKVQDGSQIGYTEVPPLPPRKCAKA